MFHPRNTQQDETSLLHNGTWNHNTMKHWNMVRSIPGSCNNAKFVGCLKQGWSNRISDSNYIPIQTKITTRRCTNKSQYTVSPTASKRCSKLSTSHSTWTSTLYASSPSSRPTVSCHVVQTTCLSLKTKKDASFHDGWSPTWHMHVLVTTSFDLRSRTCFCCEKCK